jgi:hypothetical protein
VSASLRRDLLSPFFLTRHRSVLEHNKNMALSMREIKTFGPEPGANVQSRFLAGERAA